MLKKEREKRKRKKKRKKERKKKKKRKRKEKKKRKKSKSISVNPLAVSTLSNMRKAGNTKRGSHQKLLYLLQCSEKSMSIQKDLSNGIHAE